MTPTPEQLAIISAATSTSDNILVSALAGAAKTSTLVMLAEALPSDLEILCLAFNKKISLEMQERLPANCKAMTLNSLGHRTWSGAIGKRLRLETKKTYTLVGAAIEEHSRADATDLYKNMAELMQLVSFAKACGYVPTDTYPRAKRLLNDHEFFEHIDQKLSPMEQDLIRSVMLTSIKQAHDGLIDFDDQIYMPTLFHGAFPRYKLTLVDEAQDLSALNHATLRKMCGDRRLIAVGDACQAIYGFRGAHEDGMSKLRSDFSMREMTLSVSFRCAQAIVSEAHWRAPHMRWPEWAKPGSVTHMTSWTAADLPEDAAIICRNNAPLFGMAIRLLKSGRTCELDGKDIIKAITKVMSKFGSHDMTQTEVFDCIDRWLAKELAKTKPHAHARIRDRADCMKIFTREGSTLSDALHYAEHISRLHSPLKLLTGHKSKGLEFTHVYFLDEQLISGKDQDPNVRYVIQTRAKETLTYITSTGFVENAETDMA